MCLVALALQFFDGLELQTAARALSYESSYAGLFDLHNRGVVRQYVGDSPNNTSLDGFGLCVASQRHISPEVGTKV